MGNFGARKISTKAPTPSPWKCKSKATQSEADRERVRDEKRDAVLTTAAQLFSEQGFHNTTLADIARQLHITKPALYHYFSSKDEILVECTRTALRAVEKELERAMSDGSNGLTKLERFLTWYAQNMTTVFGMCLVRVAEQDLELRTQQELHTAKKVVNECFRKLIELGVSDGSIAPCDSKIATFSVAGAVHWIGHWYKPGGRWSAPVAAAGVVKSILYGLAAKPK